MSATEDGVTEADIQDRKGTSRVRRKGAKQRVDVVKLRRHDLVRYLWEVLRETNNVQVR